MRGLREVWVCGMMSTGLGESVLVFFGERGLVAECGGCSEWSGVSRLDGGRVRV